MAQEPLRLRPPPPAWLVAYWRRVLPHINAARAAHGLDPYPNAEAAAADDADGSLRQLAERGRRVREDLELGGRAP